MATLIIRDVPEKTYKQLKARAERHRRSLSKEALVLLEEELNLYSPPPIDFSNLTPMKLKNPPKDLRAWILKAKQEGRE